MDEDRFVISDALWEQMWPLLPGKVGDPGASGRNNRRFMEAVLWRVRTGSPWRDLPKDFGNWNSVFKRFRRWANAGVFERLFNVINGELDLRALSWWADEQDKASSLYFDAYPASRK